MNIIDNQEIHLFLFKQDDFLKALQDVFDKNQIDTIVNYSNDLTKEYPEIMDQFYDWFNDLKGTNNILSIGWDSNNWGPGGIGFINFSLVFGLVKMSSSDFEDDHTEIFNKDSFEPWCIEDLQNDFIEISSDIYSDSELVEIAGNLGMKSTTILVVNGKRTKRK